MSTLLMRAAAPLQSWGGDAKFERRGTERVPTKSGIIGMIASALGRRRNESVDDLLTLRFGVRADREGVLQRDFHTAKRDKLAYVTHRYYLADAVFLVGLEGEEDQLKEIEYALYHPAFPLYLGRRSRPPEGQVSLGIRSGKTLLTALQEEPLLVSKRTGDSSRMRIVYDAYGEELHTYMQHDLPLSYDSTHRKYGFRRVSEMTAEGKIEETLTIHDPFSELKEG